MIDVPSGWGLIVLCSSYCSKFGGMLPAVTPNAMEKLVQLDGQRKCLLLPCLDAAPWEHPRRESPLPTRRVRVPCTVKGTDGSLAANTSPLLNGKGPRPRRRVGPRAGF